MKYLVKTTLATLLGVLVTVVYAEQARMPGDAEINKAMGEVQRPDWGAVEKQKAGAHEEFNAATSEVTPQMIEGQKQRFDAIDVVGLPGVDIEKLAKQYQELNVPQNQEPQEEGSLYVFVSMSMPKASMARVIADAEKTGAILVWRGLVGESFKETFGILRQLIGERTVSMQIDPTKYERFGVAAAPATVLLLEPMKRCGDKCVEPPPRHYRVDGDVSLEYALGAIARAKPDARTMTEGYLAKLTERP